MISTTTEFFDFIFGDEPNMSQMISIFKLPSRENRIFDNAEKAGYYCDQETEQDVYFRVTLMHESGKKCKNTRGDAGSTIAATCLWADLDVKPGAFTSKDDAVRFVQRLPLYPSLIVCSGNGIHAYWMLNEPLTVDIEKWSKGWHGYICAVAKDHEKQIENLGDSARVLRPVGTINHKNGNGLPVFAVEENQRRYYIDDFETFLLEVVESEKLEGFVPEFGQLDDSILNELLDWEKFSDAWYSCGEGYDASSVDQSIATLMFIRGYSESTIAAALYRRRNERTPKGHDKKLGKISRASYIVPTLAKAREWAKELAKEYEIDEIAIAGIMNSIPIVKSEDCTPPQTPAKRRMPDEVFNVGGIIGRLLEHNSRTSLGPMPEIALGGALALMSVITGHKVRDFRNLRTNLYVICLAPSGAGKDDSRKANKRILLKLGHHNMIAPTKIKSSAGMVSALVKNNPSLFQLDELSQVLRTMRDPDRNPHMSDVLTVLLEAWSETTGIYEPGAYADSSKNPIIDQPHLVLYGTSVAANFWPSLTKANMSDGLVGRLLVFEHDGYPDDSDGGDPEDWDESLLAEVQSWCDFQPPSTGNMKSPNPVMLGHTEEALDRYMDHRRAINARKNENEIRSALWRRCNEKVGKLAMLSACSRNPPITGSLPQIELSDVNWAIQVSNWLTNNMLERSRLLVSESIHEANLNRILAAMPDWTRKEKVGQAVRSIRADERDKIIRYAVLDEIIEARQIETGGRIATEYRAARGFNP